MAAVRIMTVVLCCCCCWSWWWCVTSITCEPPPMTRPMLISTTMKCFGKCCTALSNLGHQWKFDLESVATASPIPLTSRSTTVAVGKGRRACCKRELECICQECRTTTDADAGAGHGGGGGNFHHELSFDNSSSRISQLPCIPSTAALVAALLGRQKAEQLSGNQSKRRPDEKGSHDKTSGKTERMRDLPRERTRLLLLDQLVVVGVELDEKVKDGDGSLVSFDERDTAEKEENDTESSTCKGDVGDNCRLNKTGNGCLSVFSTLNFWGTHQIVFVNITYIFPYMLVLLVYLVMPGLRRRAYDRAVIWYNLLQILINGILIVTGVSLLCHTTIHPRLFAPLGLMLMFLTISSTFWLFIVCIDMTLVITRLRWTPRSEATRNHQQQRQQEMQKLRVYATCSWAAGLLPTVLAAILEFSPLLDEFSPLRPNFHRFQTATMNLTVILYIATLPILTCLANTLLLFYTTYRIIVTEKSIRSMQLTIGTTSGSRSNHPSKQTRKRYWLFLKLYLLMDATWITNLLPAFFVDLWLLKFLGILQPIVTMLVILPRHTTLRMGEIIFAAFNRPILGLNRLLRHLRALPLPLLPMPLPLSLPMPMPLPLAYRRPLGRTLDTSTESPLPPTPTPHPHSNPV